MGAIEGPDFIYFVRAPKSGPVEQLAYNSAGEIVDRRVFSSRCKTFTASFTEEQAVVRMTWRRVDP